MSYMLPPRGRARQVGNRGVIPGVGLARIDFGGTGAETEDGATGVEILMPTKTTGLTDKEDLVNQSRTWLPPRGRGRGLKTGDWGTITRVGAGRDEVRAGRKLEVSKPAVEMALPVETKCWWFGQPPILASSDPVEASSTEVPTGVAAEDTENTCPWTSRKRYSHDMKVSCFNFMLSGGR